MALLKYFRKVEKELDDDEEDKGCSNKALVSVEGTTKSDSRKKRGTYLKFDPKEKAVIAKYACEHGVAKAVKHFKGQELKKSTVRDWKTALKANLRRSLLMLKKAQLLLLIF